MTLRTVSYASFIFSGDPALAKLGAPGLSCMLLHGISAALRYLWYPSVPGSLGGFSSTATPLLAGLAVKLFASPTLDATEKSSTLFMAFLLAGLSTGSALWCVGHFHLGRFLQFFPFPVIRGFFGAVGVGMVAGAWQLMLGFPATRWDQWRPGLSGSISKFCAGNAVMLLLTLVKSSQGQKRSWLFPFSMLLILFTFYVLMALGGYSFQQAREDYWVFPSSNEDQDYFWVYLRPQQTSW